MHAFIPSSFGKSGVVLGELGDDPGREHHMSVSHRVTHRPVVVEVAQFEGESLHVVRLQAVVVIDDVIVGGGNCSLASCLTDQVEVVPERKTGTSVRKKGQPRKPNVKNRQQTLRGKLAFEQHLPLRTCGLGVHHGAERRVLHRPVPFGEESGCALLPDHDHRQLGTWNQKGRKGDAESQNQACSFLVIFFGNF